MIRIVSVLLVTFLAIAADGKEKARKGPEEIGGTDPGRGINFYSIEKEMAFGKRMSQEVERETRLLDDPVITEYVNRLGQNLVRHSDAKVPFTIKVIESDEVNAFALPGGYLFVNTALIRRAGNEAELAGVLAHEIAHVAARHGTKQATRGELIDYASIPLLFTGGWAGFAARRAIGLAVPTGLLRFSRGMETEADRLGLEYLYRSGYDPVACIDFFEKMNSLNKGKPGTIARMFSSHPMTGDRIRHAQQQIEAEFKPLREYVLDTSEFRSIQARLAAHENRRAMVVIRLTKPE